MKKRLFIISKESGFILPVVLFVTAIVMLLVTTHIYTYQNNIRITDNQLEQVKIETLFQMGLTQVKEDITSIETFPATVQYTFPDGETNIYIVHQGNNRYQLTFTIATKDNKANYKISHPLE